MAFNNDTDTGPDLPPGSPALRQFEGPWFSMQLSLSLALGLFSFALFSFCRRRWPLLFSPRTKLKGAAVVAHVGTSASGWILPTIRVSELSVLQIVGLDAAVLLNFLKTSFYLFLACSGLAMAILMPVNVYVGRSMGGDGDDDDDDPDTGGGWLRLLSFPEGGGNGGNKGGGTAPDDWLDLISEANAYLFVQFLFTYMFTFVAMRFLYSNYKRFVRARQLFSLELVHSIQARTVMVSYLPPHLRGERALATYYENMGFAVESVSVCREIGALKPLLDKRTAALLALESAWTSYVGNPCAVEAYDPSQAGPLIDIDLPPGHDSSLNPPPRLVVPHRPRPTLRPKWYSLERVDAIEHLEAHFRALDEQVRKKRRSGKFRATHCAFVTFESMSSAQAVSQLVTAPVPSSTTACLSPEPRDIVWANMTLSPRGQRTRDLAVSAFIVLMFFFWALPVTALSSLLSYEEIQRVMPWLGRLIDSSDAVRAFVQNSLPSIALITLNGLLPFLFEGLSYLQGFRARSWIEYSLLKKYFLFLLVNVVFEFLLASTYWQLIRDLANSPAKVPEKLAMALQKGNARHFFLSYVILQGFGIMPLQLLNLGVIIPRFFYRAFITRTPRDFAELNAPPMVNYGAVYPQAILVFVITMLYSVIQPLILFFGAAYFGISYVVYKYKLLFVFYKPYESQGQAWPITFVRMMWGVLIFQVFMAGIFLLKQSFILASLMAPLILFTTYWTWSMDALFGPLSNFVGLSSVCEVQRGEDSDEVARLRSGHPVSWSQSNLNRRRYAQNDETLYVAPEDDRTDYSQPPMTNWYDGVLNTGKRRYGHPALTGILPSPWLPLKKGQTLANYLDGRRRAKGGDGDGNDAVVLTLRRRKSMARPDVRRQSSIPLSQQQQGASQDTLTHGANPWDSASVLAGRQVSHRLSFDHATGVINLPEEDDEPERDLEAGAGAGVDESSSDSEYGSASSMSGDGAHAALSDIAEHEHGRETSGEGTSGGASSAGGTRHRTYYHHPEKRKSMTIS
ncbi:DUF221-domain-containing protein [Exidia glandulosa HHB12029]|uniref:DUF221-domain-containing protein n=1 Tax=Exidia glandulosa HHB12029 TaxID=1314781 RepID=A0A165IB91_EXIGL|nr:DUF221-domain-containing protein [Exidia glandulosa HHB12029]